MSDNADPSYERRVSQDANKKTCWVCFASEEDDRTVAWVQPCRCRGTTKWVHQMCLQRWIDEKQRGNSTAKVSCPQCGTPYTIEFPPFGATVSLLDIIERTIQRLCPFVAGGIVVGSIFWSAVTYGAVTVMQVLGHKEGLSVMEQADPLFLLVGLPTIPIVLILGKMVRWEDYVLKLWRKHVTKHLRFGFSYGGPNIARVPGDVAPYSDPISATRVLCGALILPTVATIAGKLCFSQVASNFQRTLLGGIMFLGVKGICRLYYKQQQYMRQAQRRVLDFEEPKTTVSAGVSPISRSPVSSGSSSNTQSNNVNTDYSRSVQQADRKSVV